MRFWSPLLATALVLASVRAQFHDDVGVEMVADDFTEEEYEMSPANDGIPPCNGYPEYHDLPIDRAFYLGAHAVGTHVFSTQSKTKDVAAMLRDGIRYLDINICNSYYGKIVVCGECDATQSLKEFREILEDIFVFARRNPEQFIIVNIRSEIVDMPVNTEHIETEIDKECKIHTELTAGTKEYIDGKCPFVETYDPRSGNWPSIGKIVNYDPEMSQWVGDGELVGVRSKVMFTLADHIRDAEDYENHYFSPVFWRSVTEHISGMSSLEKHLNVICKVPTGGIGLEVHPDCSKYLRGNPYSSTNVFEGLIFDKESCDLNNTPPNTFLSLISINFYDKYLDYYKDLEKYMTKLNYKKWKDAQKPAAVSTVESSSSAVDSSAVDSSTSTADSSSSKVEEKTIARDEL